MARLVLIGLPGTGKSTVARAIASRIGCVVCDTDEVLATAAAVSTGEHLRTVGEERFRSNELDALRACVDCDGVVATGGGVVETDAARSILFNEWTVWLDAPDEILIERVSDGDRPLLAGGAGVALAGLRLRRSAWYRAVARVRVDVSGPLDEVVDDVLRAMMAS